jgi:hypothetical protein
MSTGTVSRDLKPSCRLEEKKLCSIGMHDNGTLLLIGIQCFGVTDLVNKALDEEEVMTAVSRTGQEVAEGINSTESELTSNRYVPLS